MRFKEFLDEAKVGNQEKYIPIINDLLKQSKNLPLQPSNTRYGNAVLDFTPNPNQQIKNLKDPVSGTLTHQDGVKKEISVPAGYIYKSAEIKAAMGKKDYNLGEVSEGYHAAAAFARLIKRPSREISEKDVFAVIDRLENGKTFKFKANEHKNTIADEFHIIVSLKPGSWNALKNHATKEEMTSVFNEIVKDANNETSRYADIYAENGKFDLVKVIGEGAQGESETKTDIKFDNVTEKKFKNISLKVGTTKQIHQVGGGSVKGARAVNRDNRFDILQNELFGVHGRAKIADITSIKEQFKLAKTNLEAQEIAYKKAVESINENLENDPEEKTFLQTLARALKYWMVRDDDNIQLKQFSKDATFVLDAKNLDEMHKKGLDLVAVMKNSATPTIIIKDKKTNNALIQIRTYHRNDGYIRNYIEKGKLFIELTNTAN
jgi:hypothetical protein